MSHFTVGEVARMAHTTVRALHHYDDIGLLVPSRTEGGYRVYDASDLDRLREILLLRELGVPLSDIDEILRATASDRLEILRSLRDRYERDVRRAEEALAAVDRHIHRMEHAMSTDERFEGFEHFDQTEWAEEAEERWGDTPAHAESMRRAGRYGPREWRQIKEEGAAHLETLGALVREGRAPDHPACLELAEAMRLHIDRWFYPCSPGMHVRLAEMYEADPRFKATYEAVGEGAAGLIAAAIRANAGGADIPGDEMA